MTQTIIIVIYLCLIIGLGYFSSRFFKGGSNDFFVASRSIGPFVLFMSIFGTTMTAFAMVGSTGQAFSFGVATYGKIASSSALIHSACFFLIGLPLWALGKRHGFVTQIEFFRSRFESSKIGYVLFPILVGLIIPYLLVGLMGGGSFMEALTRGSFPDVEMFQTDSPRTNGSIPPWLTSIVISIVVLYYVFAGGVRSAAWANTFQTIVFMIMGFIAFYTIAAKLGGMQAASAMIEQSKAVRSGNITELQFFTYCFIPLSVGMFPHLFQNFLTAKSAKTFRLAIIGHPLCIMITWIPCILIGLWATGALMPDGSNVVPATAPGAAVLGMMVAKLTTPIVAGLVGAGVLAAIMSSLDSQFVSVGTMFTKDIVVHAFGKDRFSDKQLVWLARIFILLIVAITYIITLFATRSVFTLGIWCFSGFAGLFPLIFAAIYWKRVTKSGAYAGIIAAASTWAYLFWDSGFGANRAYKVAGAMPVAYIFLACAVAMIVVSLVTAPPSKETLSKFFRKV